MSFSPMRFWVEGGWVMYPVLMLGGMGAVCSLTSLFVHEKVVARVALLLLLGSFLVGAFGMMYNRRYVDVAVAAANPEYQALLREVGNKEAMRPLQLGGALLAVGSPLALVGLFLGGRRKPV